MTDKYSDILIRIADWNEQQQAYRVEATVGDGNVFNGDSFVSMIIFLALT